MNNNRIIAALNAKRFMLRKRRAAGSVQGFGVFAIIIFASFWIGSSFLSAVNFNTTQGFIAMLVGALFPIAIGYFAWIRFGRKYDTS